MATKSRRSSPTDATARGKTRVNTGGETVQAGNVLSGNWGLAFTRGRMSGWGGFTLFAIDGVVRDRLDRR
jgi:ribosomal protein L27